MSRGGDGHRRREGEDTQAGHCRRSSKAMGERRGRRGGLGGGAGVEVRPAARRPAPTYSQCSTAQQPAPPPPSLRSLTGVAGRALGVFRHLLADLQSLRGAGGLGGGHALQAGRETGWGEGGEQRGAGEGGGGTRQVLYCAAPRCAATGTSGGAGSCQRRGVQVVGVPCACGAGGHEGSACMRGRAAGAAASLPATTPDPLATAPARPRRLPKEAVTPPAGEDGCAQAGRDSSARPAAPQAAPLRSRSTHTPRGQDRCPRPRRTLKEASNQKSSLHSMHHWPSARLQLVSPLAATAWLFAVVALHCGDNRGGGGSDGGAGQLAAS